MWIRKIPSSAVADPRWVKIDETCRQLQVNDGFFASIEQVPTRAITLTQKVFAGAACLSSVIPVKTKAAAVAATLNGPILTDCSATLCRRHEIAQLFLDTDIDAASLLSI